MIEKIDDGKLAISGRVDSNNAGEVEEELLKHAKVGEDIVIDASGLEYISSAGLRSFLKLKKTIKAEVSVVDVSPEIYDIFEVTGFVEILDIHKRLKEISIDGCEVVGEGANGKVYRLDDETIIKVYEPGVPMSVVEDERNISRAAFLAGVPTAISYDVAKVGDSYGAVYEMLHAKTLSEVIMANPEKAEEFGVGMGKLLKELHHTNADKEKLKNMNDIYRSRAEGMGKYLTDAEHEKLMKVYNMLDDRDTLLHGDYHTKNIMYMNGEMMFIDMGDVGYGHPLLDIGGTYLGMIHVGKFNPDAVPHYIGIDYDTAIKVWNAAMEEYFGKDVELGKKLAMIYGEAKYTLTPFIYSKMTDDMIEGFLNRARTNSLISESFDISPALNNTLDI